MTMIWEENRMKIKVTEIECNESVDKEIATWASGGITTGQLQQKLFDTTGIDLRLDGIDFRKETA